MAVSDEGGDVFAPTLDGFRRYVQTTRPPPAKEAVLGHARTVLTASEVKTLGREYRKLSRAAS